MLDRGLRDDRGAGGVVTALLNPDVELLNGVQRLAEACVSPGIAIAAGRLVDSNGKLWALIASSQTWDGEPHITLYAL